MTEQNQTPRQDDDAEGHHYRRADKADTKDKDAEGHVHRSKEDDTKGDDTEGHHIR